MIARWPGRITAGSVSNYPWAFWDLMPTIAELVGTRSLRDSDGVSVAPVLFGQSPRVQERTLYWENYDGRGFSQAARIGNWKGVRHGLKEPLELYDLSTDEGETKNVASANPHVVQRMEEYLAQSRTDSLEYPAS
jgi:arylsulfatase A-like enzyme